MKNNILVLGATGMLGHTVYAYLTKAFPGTVWGTGRETSSFSNFLTLKASTLEKDLKVILKKVDHIDYVINCVAVLDSKGKKQLFLVNAEFPRRLSELALQNNFKLIHISTDAVFPPNSGEVNELSSPAPIDDYGKSKLGGEIDSSCLISVRTSLLGLDPLKHRGLLEMIVSAPNPIPGFTNQIWTGCTTLQFAKLCEEIIVNNKFDGFRQLSPVLHFAPLGPVTKYQIINTFAQLMRPRKTVQKKLGSPVNRILKSVYFAYFSDKKYTNDAKLALNDLVKFEKFDIV